MKVKTIRNVPWLVPASIEFLRLKIEKTFEEDRCSKVIETGCGGSTIFFADLGCEIVSFEHSRKWFNIVDKELDNYERYSIDLRFDPNYPKFGLRDLKNDYFDFALIDGRGRVRSISTVLKKIRNGGWLILDNAERARYKVAVNMLNQTFKETIIFKKDWTTTFWRIQNKKE